MNMKRQGHKLPNCPEVLKSVTPHLQALSALVGQAALAAEIGHRLVLLGETDCIIHVEVSELVQDWKGHGTRMDNGADEGMCQTITHRKLREMPTTHRKLRRPAPLQSEPIAPEA